MSKSIPSVIERYFTRYFWTDINKKTCEDQCILLHSNRICVLTLAKSHCLLKDGGPIQVNYSPQNKIDRRANKVVGKGKRGAQWVDPMAILCEITTGNGNSYMLRSCVQGKLIEINENLISNPELLLSKTETDGYIAIIAPKLKATDELFGHLLTESQYDGVLESRCEQPKAQGSIDVLPSNDGQSEPASEPQSRLTSVNGDSNEPSPAKRSRCEPTLELGSQDICVKPPNDAVSSETVSDNESQCEQAVEPQPKLASIDEPNTIDSTETIPGNSST